MTMADCLKTRPERVALVAMGKSKHNFLSCQAVEGSRRHLYDEVWVVNAMWLSLKHDKCFAMDDFQLFKNRPEAFPHLYELMKESKTPIITSTCYPAWPAHVAYPLEDVIRFSKMPYFANTIAYAVAYAIMTCVKELHLYGCDFEYGPDQKWREDGRANVEFWCGFGMAQGMVLNVPGDSGFLKSPERPDDPYWNSSFYGYQPRGWPKLVLKEEANGDPVPVGVEFEPASED